MSNRMDVVKETVLNLECGKLNDLLADLTAREQYQLAKALARVSDRLLVSSEMPFNIMEAIPDNYNTMTDEETFLELQSEREMVILHGRESSSYTQWLRPWLKRPLLLPDSKALEESVKAFNERYPA
jgi:hypothetical protein